MSTPGLAKIFEPRSVAVIGASSRPGSVGQTVLLNMIQAGFGGALYAINPKRREILGRGAYPDVGNVPERPDLAVICTPAATTPAILRRCGETGIGGVIIISAGFREAGAAGKDLEATLLAEARRWPDMRVIGPNCLGVLSPRFHINASFAAGMARAGRIAFISQSGALCTAILDWSLTENVGFSHFVSLGNALDVDFSDLISYFADDRHTSSIVLYVESIAKAHEFLAAASAFARVKPIVAYKAGRFEESARAAASHTGAMAGVDAVYDAAFRRAGVVRVDEAEDMFDCAELLAGSRLPAGPRLAIVSNAGGPAVMAADELLKHRGELARFAESTIEQLNALLPPQWSHANPVDVLGDAGPDRYARAVEIVLADPQADALLLILAPQAMTDPAEIARATARMASQTSKPVLASWMGGASVAEGRKVLAGAGIATYDLPERAIRAFHYLWRHVHNRQPLCETPSAAPPAVHAASREKARAILAEAAGISLTLSEAQSKALLTAYGISTPMPRLAHDADEAVALCDEIGYPVVMKLQSPDVTHKTEVGGVELGVADAGGARRTYHKIVESAGRRCPQARVEGVTVQPMASCPTGVELIVGAKRDPVFGPVLLVGAGGILAELLGDRALELLPLSERLARKMLESLRAWPLLSGFRGRPAVRVDRVIDTLMQVAHLVGDCPEIVELDVNPLLATPEGAIALDARVVLGAASATPMGATLA
jgi:acetyltransferase